MRPKQPGGRFRLRRSIEQATIAPIDYRRVGSAGRRGSGRWQSACSISPIGRRRAAVDWLAASAAVSVPFDRDRVGHTNRRAGFEEELGHFSKACDWARGSRSTISVLDVTPDGLAVAFKIYAWVEEVIKVAYGPGRIRVELRYRRAGCVGPASRRRSRLMVDEEGIILPTEDVDVAAARPSDQDHGGSRSLASAGPSSRGWSGNRSRDASGLEQVDERILAAAKLAGFLLRRAAVGRCRRSPALRIERDHIVTDFDVARPVRDQCRGSSDPLGRCARERNVRVSLSAEEKWAILRRWAETHTRSISRDGRFLGVFEDGTAAPVSSPRAILTAPKSPRRPAQGKRSNDRTKSPTIGIIADDLVPLRRRGSRAREPRAVKLVKQGGSRRFTVMPNRRGG